MFSTSKPRALVRPLMAVVLSLCAGSALAQGSAANTPGMASSGAMSAHGSEAMSQHMMEGMRKMQGMKMSGNHDKDFAMMMKMHHQQALEMAQMELDHGKSPEMKAMAKKIIAAQKKEIGELERWIKAHP